MKFLGFSLLLLCSVSYADMTKMVCYSGGKVIYSGETDQIDYEDGMIFFLEKDKKEKKVILTTADCIITVTDKKYS